MRYHIVVNISDMRVVSYDSYDSTDVDPGLHNCLHIHEMALLQCCHLIMLFQSWCHFSVQGSAYTFHQTHVP